MKELTLALSAIVLFVKFGGGNVPKILKDNKQTIYGIAIGLIFCSFFGVNIEGLECGDNQQKKEICVDIGQELCQKPSDCQPVNCAINPEGPVKINLAWQRMADCGDLNSVECNDFFSALPDPTSPGNPNMKTAVKCENEQGVCTGVSMKNDKYSCENLMTNEIIKN